MNNKKKFVIITIVLFITIIFTVSISYSFFTYDKVSTKNHTILFGDISLTYNEESNNLSLTNSFPETKEEARARNDNYITFTIDGVNTSNKTIYYEVDLLYGNDIVGKDRILDKYLSFDLTEIDENNNEIFVVDNRTYDVINNKIIYTNIVSSNTSSDITRTYRLRMWINKDVIISNTYADASYTPDEYSNLFASVKLRVYGDFREKEVGTTRGCFLTSVISEQEKTLSIDGYYRTYIDNNDNVIPILIADLNTNLTNDEVTTCADFLANKYDGETTYSSHYEPVCRNEVLFDNHLLSELLLINNVAIGNYYYENDYLFSSEELDYLEENNIISNVRDVSNIACGENVEIPLRIDGYKVTKINDYAFRKRDITDVIIPATVTTIGNEAFLMNNLTNLYLPNSVTSIGSNSFSSNSLNNIDLPESLINIGNYSFSYNPLTKVNLPSNITYLGSGSFMNCQMTSIEIPTTITALNGNTFANNFLTSVSIPDNIVSIGYGDFEHNQISSISLSSNLVTLGEYSFYENFLTEIELPNGLDIIGNGALGKNQLTSIDIPSSVTSIGNGSFTENYLTSLVIPNNVTFIGHRAFEGNQIASLTIGNSVETISDRAFNNNLLTSVDVPDSTTFIGDSAFEYNQLTTINVGSGITSIDRNAFCRHKAISPGPSNPDLTIIRIKRTCNDIKNNLLYKSTNYYPWLYPLSPYYSSYGTNKYTKIYGYENSAYVQCESFRI